MHLVQVLQGARLSFEWLQFRILSRNLKVRSTLYDSKFACEVKVVNAVIAHHVVRNFVISVTKRPKGPTI